MRRSLAEDGSSAPLEERLRGCVVLERLRGSGVVQSRAAALTCPQDPGSMLNTVTRSAASQRSKMSPEEHTTSPGQYWHQTRLKYTIIQFSLALRSVIFELVGGLDWPLIADISLNVQLIRYIPLE